MGINKLSKQILIYVPGSLLPAVFGLLSTAIFTRLISTYEFGRYSLVMGFTMLVTELSIQWLQQSISRYLPAHSDDEEKLKIKNTFVIAVFFVLISILCLSVIIFSVFHIYISSWMPYYLAGMLYILCSILYNPLLVIFQAEQQAREYTLFNICNAVLKLVIGFSIVYFVARQGYGLILGASLSLVILLPVMWNKAGLTSPLSLLRAKAFHSYRHEINRYVDYGLPMLVWFLAASILNVGDRYIIQWFRGSSDVGIYSANYTLVAGAIALLSTPVLLAAHPFLMKSWSTGNKEETGRWLATIAEWFANAGVILTGLVWLFSKDISILLLGKEYQQGHVIMPIVLAGIVLWQMAQYVQKPLEFAAQTGLMMKLALTTALVGVILDIIFVPRFGYVAAAWATFASYLLYVVMAGLAGRKILKWRMRWQVVMRNVILTAIAFKVMGGTRMLVETKYGYSIGFLTTFLSCIVLLSVIAYHSRSFQLLRNKR